MEEENAKIEELNNRMTSIEIKFSYLEDFLDKLQNIAVEHDKIIEQLRTENRILKQKVRELVENQEGDIPNRRPPHY